MAFLGSAHGQEKPVSRPEFPIVKGDFSRLKKTQAKARVIAVVDGVTVVLDDKSTVRLVGVLIPWDTPEDPGERMKRGADMLKREVLGRFVNVYQPMKDEGGRTNRIGQKMAQLERDDGAWVQGALIQTGTAMVLTTETNPEMAGEMLKLEAQARDDQKGIWADPRLGVTNTDDAGRYINEFKIVEGVVFSNASKSNQVYLNFGRDWKTDFTIMIPASRRTAFARDGMDIMGLVHKRLRVRGWVEELNGPMISVTHPAQIEILPDTPPDTPDVPITPITH